MKKITYEEAFRKYLDEDIDVIMPFEGYFGSNYISYLKKKGYVIVDEK